MSFQLACLQRIERAFTAWEDLLHLLPDEALAHTIPAPSNSIGEQIWCVVGARESYTRAIAAGSWQGFDCSLTSEEITTCSGILAGLQRSAAAFRQAAAAAVWSEEQVALALDLLEHENQHQGQLIRYLYAQRIDFPASWKQRWSL